jgi:hypothetical protein
MLSKREELVGMILPSLLLTNKYNYQNRDTTTRAYLMDAFKYADEIIKWENEGYSTLPTNLHTKNLT